MSSQNTDESGTDLEVLEGESEEEFDVCGSSVFVADLKEGGGRQGGKLERRRDERRRREGRGEAHEGTWDSMPRRRMLDHDDV